MNGKTKFQEKFDYIIDKDGVVKIGSKHSFLSDGESVRVAGELKVRNGNIVRIDNASGHYLPTSEEASRFKTMFEEAGVDMNKTKQITYDKSGNEIK